MYFQETHGIRITVEPKYLASQSRPDQGYYFFSYRIGIQNLNDKPVKLLRRHWIITDGLGVTREVFGEGVVGEQPTLLGRGSEKSSYEYSSFCPLQTKTGNMRGSFEFETAQGLVKAKIPLFFLREMTDSAASSPAQDSPQSPLV